MKNIRKITIDEYAELIRLWRCSGLEHKPHGRDSEKSLSKQIEENPEAFWGYYLDDKLIGSIIVSHDGRKGWINRLAVQPDYRHSGIAKSLLQFSEDLLHSMGINIIAALIESDNTPSLTLFQNSGYETCSDIVYLRHILKENI